MSAQRKPRYTPEHYLEIERAAEYKSEYITGEIFAMAGASFEHNIISANLLYLLGSQLRGKPCQPLGSDMRLQAGLAGPFFYPDALVVCEEPLFRPGAHLDTLQNPTIIFEVLSPSTEAYDRGEKFAYYRRIASLQMYLLVSQDKPRIECYTRQEADRWLLAEFDGLDAIVPLDVIGCELPLAEVYDRIAFPPAPDADRDEQEA